MTKRKSRNQPSFRLEKCNNRIQIGQRTINGNRNKDNPITREKCKNTTMLIVRKGTTNDETETNLEKDRILIFLYMDKRRPRRSTKISIYKQSICAIKHIPHSILR